MNLNPFAVFRTILSYLETIHKAVEMGTSAAERIQNDIAAVAAVVASIASDVDAIKTIVQNASNDAGIPAAQASDLADKMDAAVSSLNTAVDSLNAIATPAAPTTGGETPVNPTP